MGQSTNAILAFGFDLGEPSEELLKAFGTDPDNDSSIDFEQWIETQAGLVYPAGGTDKAYRAYRKARDAAAAACPVDLITHCSGDYPMYFLAVRGTEMTAHRGDPTAVTIEAVAPEKIQAMRELCEKHGIEWKEPGWHIFSMWL